MRLVRVLSRGNGQNDVVIRELDGAAVTSMVISDESLAVRVADGEVAVMEVDVLTSETVAFLMRALLAGRVTREVACRLVTPWVEGDLPSTPLAEDGAQLLHGFDVIAKDGRERHESVAGEGSLVLSESEVRQRCLGWLARVSLPER